MKRDLLVATIAAMIGSVLTLQFVERDAGTAEIPAIPAVRETGPRHSNYPANETVLVESAGDAAVPAARKAESAQGVTLDMEIKEASGETGFHSGRGNEYEQGFTGFFSKEHLGNAAALSAKIETRFYLEEWNQEWAGRNESGIYDLFKNSESLADISPLQVACRSKNCQVVLPALSQDQVRLLSEKFMKAATAGDIGMQNKLVSFFPDTATGRLIFYLSENGNMDLFQ